MPDYSLVWPQGEKFMPVMMTRRSSTRYRGKRGPGKGLLIGILAVVLLAAGVFFVSRLLLKPAPEPEPAAVTPPEATPAPTPEPAPALAAVPESVRGIYISGPVAGDPYMDTLVELVDATELNTVVIDVKNDEGNLTYRPASGQAVELGACVNYIRDLPGLVEELKSRGMYTVARVVAFKDPVLAQARPELALHGPDGKAVSEGGGAAWVNPYDPEVRAYLTEVALGAAEAGFDEVQFDYVRFPTGKGTDQVDYGRSAEGITKEDAVVDFLASIRVALHAQGVRLSADVFGTVIDSKLDAGLIGQDYARMASAVDYLCPMVYPSHYAAGSFGLDVPDSQPYETVVSALVGSRGALSRSTQQKGQAGVRPWLQDFTATWVKGHIPYGEVELRAQIQAVYDAGYSDWLLWNAKNTYTAQGLLPAE